jgi:ribosome-binding protein aMBF1 (putative translation factor)
MTLEEYRIFKGWTFRRLGKFLKRPPETVRRWCNGERVPRPPVAQQIEKKTKGLVTANDFYRTALS